MHVTNVQINRGDMNQINIIMFEGIFKVRPAEELWGI